MHKVAVSSREFLTVLRFPTVVIFYFPDFWRRSRVTDKKIRLGNHQGTFARPVISVPDTDYRLGSESDDRYVGKSLDTCKHKIREAAGEVEVTSA